MALDFAAGCLGGAAGVLVGHPLDTVKVHLQLHSSAYKGTFDCLRSIVVKNGFKGLYRGISSPLSGVAFINAIVFGVYGNLQRNLENPNSLNAHLCAGAFAGLAQSPICGPMEMAKTRLQLSNNHQNGPSSPIECLKAIYLQEGYKGLFRGTGVTVMREVPGFGSYFFMYELLTRSQVQPLSTPVMLLAGGLAGSFSWTVSYPIDVIKSRLQVDGLFGPRQYSGAMDCLKQSVRTEGYPILFRGLNSALIRAFPMNAATFATVTWTFRLFLDNKEAEPNICPMEKKQTASMWQRWSETLMNWRRHESLGILEGHHRIVIVMEAC